VRCRHARNIIAEHLAGEDQGLPEDLQAHLDDCPRCAGLWRDQTRIHTALTDAGAAPAPPAPADLAQRARQRLTEGERVPPAPLRVVLVYGSLAAIVIIAAVAIFANRGRVPGRSAPHVARADKQPVPHGKALSPGGTASSLPVSPGPSKDARVDKQPVPHEKALSPGGTASSLPVSPGPSKDARVDEQPVPHESDEVDLLIIVWATPLVVPEEEHGTAEDNWRPHTDLLSPRSADVVAQATQVASLVRGPYPSAEPSVPALQSATFAALPVQSMDIVAQLTSVQADFDLPETESLPDPASSDVTTAPEPLTMIVDSIPSGGEDDEQPCDLQILPCAHAGDDPLLLCGELGVGGGGLI